MGLVTAEAISESVLLFTSVFFSAFEKLLLVMDWFEVEDVAVEVEFEAGDQVRMARQWMTGRTSRQNSGWYNTSLHF